MRRIWQALVAFWHSRWFGVTVILALFLCLLLLYPGNNLFTWISAKRDIADQERRMHQLDREITRMQEEINMLTTNRDSLEKFARENFHFTAPGEDVYLVDE